MKSNRLAKVIGIIAFFVVVFFVLSSLGIVVLPRGIQRILFTITRAQSNSATMETIHEATRVDAEGDAYTFRYRSNKRGTIKKDSARCESCHGDMLQKEGGKPKYPIHEKMLNASMLSFSCTDCHKKVDMGRRSPSRVTMRVDRTLCPACHEPAGGSATAEESKGSKWGTQSKELPNLMSRHGKTKKEGKKWIKDHPRVAMSIGIDQCKKCHIEGSELDFCRECHLRGGFRSSSHRVTYKAKINELYPGNKRQDVVETKWRGYHFVFVRKALEKLGTKVDSPQNLPMEKIQKLPCGACHRLKDWCTRCHIKHNSNWLNPNVGHPSYVDKYGKRYCRRCHDSLGSKCVSCHAYVGRLQ